MSYPAIQHPRLRLVRDDASDAGDQSPQGNDFDAAKPTRDIIKENRLSAHAGWVGANQIDARDPRWILAMQTQARLQGTILTPERRDELLASGRKLGLRPFESNLIIAVVQDHARRSQPLRYSAGDECGLIGVRLAASKPTDITHTWLWWLAALASAAVVAMFIIRVITMNS